MNTFKFKKGVYIVKRNYETESKIDSYSYELYIGKNKNDVKKQYDNCHDRKLYEKGFENSIQDVTILRICQVLEKLKYMEKSPYFNLQDITVLNWLEQEFKQILKESEDSELEKSDSEKRNLKIIKKEEKDAAKNNN